MYGIHTTYDHALVCLCCLHVAGIKKLNIRNENQAAAVSRVQCPRTDPVAVRHKTPVILIN